MYVEFWFMLYVVLSLGPTAWPYWLAGGGPNAAPSFEMPRLDGELPACAKYWPGVFGLPPGFWYQFIGEGMGGGGPVFTGWLKSMPFMWSAVLPASKPAWFW